MESVFRFFSNPKRASAAEATTDDPTKEATATAAAGGNNNQSSAFAEVSSSSNNAFKSNDSRAVSSHIKKMDMLIRRKLHGSGAQYNMKVVIRGERGVGKTMLWRRLQGLPYEEKYTPTPEIQTTTVNNWVYRGSEDVVKIEVWDVVDRGLARGGVSRVPEGGTLEDAVAGLPSDKFTGRGGRSLAVLDAGVVNVYQGANAVIFMLDPYRPDTLDKVEKGLAKAPINLPAVVLLNFRDKQDQEPHDETVDKGTPTGGTSVPAVQKPPPNAPASLGKPPSPTVAREEAEEDKPSEEGEKAGTGDSARTQANQADNVQTAGNDRKIGTESNPTSQSKLAESDGNEGVGAATPRAGGEPGRGQGDGGSVVTLEQARAMLDRVTKADEAEGRGQGRLVSLFDCSMKNCFGLRVLYTYLNIPYLQLKRQSLLQQAKLAGERLEREVLELEGFIGGHSYDNYMKHLQAADVDPTAGRMARAAPPGRPNAPSIPMAELDERPVMERTASVDSRHSCGKERGSKDKEKKKKHHHHPKDKDNERDRSHGLKNKNKHRHKGCSSRDKGGIDRDNGEDAAPEYEGKVIDPREFAPTTKSATDELNDFLGASSEEEASDEARRNRQKIANPLKPNADMAGAGAYEDTDSDEMPGPRASRLKRVTLKPASAMPKPTMKSTPPSVVKIEGKKPTPTSAATNSHGSPLRTTTSRSTANPSSSDGGVSRQTSAASSGQFELDDKGRVDDVKLGSHAHGGGASSPRPTTKISKNDNPGAGDVKGTAEVPEDEQMDKDGDRKRGVVARSEEDEGVKRNDAHAAEEGGLPTSHGVPASTSAAPAREGSVERGEANGHGRVRKADDAPESEDRRKEDGVEVDNDGDAREDEEGMQEDAGGGQAVEGAVAEEGSMNEEAEDADNDVGVGDSASMENKDVVDKVDDGENTGDRKLDRDTAEPVEKPDGGATVTAPVEMQRVDYSRGDVEGNSDPSAAEVDSEDEDDGLEDVGRSATVVQEGQTDGINNVDQGGRSVRARGPQSRQVGKSNVDVDGAANDVRIPEDVGSGNDSRKASQNDDGLADFDPSSIVDDDGGDVDEFFEGGSSSEGEKERQKATAARSMSVEDAGDDAAPVASQDVDDNFEGASIRIGRDGVDDSDDGVAGRGGDDEYDDPPSPKLISSSFAFAGGARGGGLGAGFASSRSSAAPMVGGGLSEAAKAAVAAALANAAGGGASSSRTRRDSDDHGNGVHGGKGKKKRKSGHKDKDRRWKDGREGDGVVADGGVREKMSYSKRHSSRKSAY